MTAESTTSLPRRLAGWRILYVDDDALVRAGVMRLLRGAGAICHLASSHDRAVELLASDPLVHVAILDFQMPDGDVAWLVRRLTLVSPGLPLLGTSGADRRADFSLRGISRFVRKPWHLDELIQSFHSLSPTRDLQGSP